MHGHSEFEAGLLFHKSAPKRVTWEHLCADKNEVWNDSWKEYTAALKVRGSLPIWLDKDMRWHGSAGKWCRRPKYSKPAIQFCLKIKGLFNLSLVPGDRISQTLLKLTDLEW